eukprot:scpid105315/ scgid31518/ 
MDPEVVQSICRDFLRGTCRLGKTCSKVHLVRTVGSRELVQQVQALPHDEEGVASASLLPGQRTIDELREEAKAFVQSLKKPSIKAPPSVSPPAATATRITTHRRTVCVNQNEAVVTQTSTTVLRAARFEPLIDQGMDMDCDAISAEANIPAAASLPQHQSMMGTMEVGGIPMQDTLGTLYAGTDQSEYTANPDDQA